MRPNFREILPILVQNEVRFIVIGGGAALAKLPAEEQKDCRALWAEVDALLAQVGAGTKP